MKRFAFACSLGAVVVVILAACKSDGDDVQTGNGTNDLTIACQQRASWPKIDANCNLCKSAVLNAHCDCSSLKDFSGECLDQENAWKAACDDATKQCTYDCTDDSCDCLEKCYANNAACKKAADARDGCMTAYCGSFCKGD